MLSLRGKTALITGATGGMGSEIAKQLVTDGVHLILLGRNEKKLKHLKDTLTGLSSVEIETVCLDLSKDIEEPAKELASRLKQLDILIHTAGVIIPNHIENVSRQEFEEQFNVNFRSAYTLVKALLPLLKEACGQVVMVNSSVVKRAKDDLSVYTSAKHALAGFTESLRQEVNPYGMRVVSIIPGKTATAMQEYLYHRKKLEMKGELLIQPYEIAYTILKILVLPFTSEITELVIRPMKKS
ncbi:MAG: SDR family NAD(P)-dependent oxidoreductase [Bacteroidales bacterium]|nr:SDR family NAD(P)-dependent oxidoreductase [Bacteroidales bacterium]